MPRLLRCALLLNALALCSALVGLQRSTKNLQPKRLSSQVSTDVTPEEPFNRKLVYGSLWGVLVPYSFLLAPGGSPEAVAIDGGLITKLITTPYDGVVTPIYASLFNIFPVVSLIYAALLLPGSKDQKTPALLSVIASFAFGFFSLGPYLGLRGMKYEVSDSNKGWGSFFYDSKILTLVLFGFSAFLLQYACFGAFDGDRVAAFVDIFRSQRLVHVSAIDMTILLLAASLNSIVVELLILSISYTTLCERTCDEEAGRDLRLLPSPQCRYSDHWYTCSFARRCRKIRYHSRLITHTGGVGVCFLKTIFLCRKAMQI